jgi:hypothetical protein
MTDWLMKPLQVPRASFWIMFFLAVHGLSSIVRKEVTYTPMMEIEQPK